MDENTRAYLHNVCWYVKGVAGKGVADGRRFGRGIGLTNKEVEAALRTLTASGYLARGPGNRVVLTPTAAYWYQQTRRRTRPQRSKRRHCHLPLRADGQGARYRRTARLIVQFPGCPPARYRAGRWTCDLEPLASWLNLMTRQWWHAHGYDPRHIWTLVRHVIQEYQAIVSDLTHSSTGG